LRNRNVVSGFFDVCHSVDRSWVGAFARSLVPEGMSNGTSVSGGVHTIPCPQLCGQIRRTASTVPVLVYGEPGPVDGVLEDLRRLAPGRMAVAVDVWVRPQQAEGTNRRLVKRALVLYHGPGDVDRGRVCRSRPLTLLLRAAACPVAPRPSTSVSNWGSDGVVFG
jgi:hypothetical protein